MTILNHKTVLTKLSEMRFRHKSSAINNKTLHNGTCLEPTVGYLFLLEPNNGKTNYVCHEFEIILLRLILCVLNSKWR